MKVALVCDWLTEIGGAERVLKSLSDIFPEAPIYTSQYRPKRIDWFNDRQVKTGWLNFLPHKLRKFIGPLRQIFFNGLDLSDYDVVISVTGAEAKAVNTGNAVHICYCHVPTQYYWQMYDDYIENPGVGWLNPLARLGLKILVKPLRRADFLAAQKPDQFVAITKYSANLIKQYYGRETKIINPPVSVENFSYELLKSGYKAVEKSVKNSGETFRFINFSRQVNWKRLDLAIEACKVTGDELVLIGDGDERKRLEELAKGYKNIKFLPQMKQSELKKHLAKADGYIFPSLEPFGIAPIEAMAAGCPVIAYGEGGALDYIKTGENGLLFKEQSCEELVNTIGEFKTKKFEAEKVAKSVEKFKNERFVKEVLALVKLKLASKKKSKKNSDEDGGLRVKIQMTLIYLMPVALFFSYQPLMQIASAQTMNFEFSIALIWLMLFSIVSLPDLRYILTKHKKFAIIEGCLVFYAFLSATWSQNTIRGILTTGILGLILYTILVFWIKIKPLLQNSNHTAKFIKILLLSTAGIGVFCIIQGFLDSFGWSRETTFMCKGCTFDKFGFPRPTGFAIEPQFMGNLLLAPILLVAYGLMGNWKIQGLNLKKWQMLGFYVFFTTVLFLTMSRGAIYAFLIGMAVLVLGGLVLKYSKMVQKIGQISMASIMAMILALGLQGLMGEISPTKAGFWVSMTKSIHQNTLGKVDLRPKEPAAEVKQTKPNTITKPHYEGYVPESTNIRLNLTKTAIGAWTESPTRVWFGVGIGGAGHAMYEKNPQLGSAKEITQNQLTEILLELGAVGLLLTGVVLLVWWKALARSSQLKLLMLTFMVTFGVSLLFFSGLPNALHIYLLPSLILIMLQTEAARRNFAIDFLE